MIDKWIIVVILYVLAIVILSYGAYYDCRKIWISKMQKYIKK